MHAAIASAWMYPSNSVTRILKDPVSDASGIRLVRSVVNQLSKRCTLRTFGSIIREPGSGDKGGYKVPLMKRISVLRLL